MSWYRAITDEEIERVKRWLGSVPSTPAWCEPVTWRWFADRLGGLLARLEDSRTPVAEYVVRLYETGQRSAWTGGNVDRSPDGLADWLRTVMAHSTPMGIEAEIELQPPKARTP